jgi:hypothetical protein
MATPDDGSLEPFIRAHVHSAEELEVLLLLFRTAGAWWSAAAIAQALNLEKDGVRRALEGLCGAFLEVRFGSEVRFRFSTLNAQRERLTARLAEAYHRDRSALMQIVNVQGAARQFSDAVRLKKDEP